MKMVRVDIVSDVVCPWCVVGFKRLQVARQELQDELALEIEWHPFELNPRMVPEGEDMAEHIARKYGSTPQAMQQNQQHLREIGRQLGFTFNFAPGRRIYNTFDAHRVLYWARAQGKQTEFNLALFQEYFTEGNNPAAPEILIRVADELGLDAKTVTDICASDRFAEEVRVEERRYTDQGIQAVPAFILNQRYLVSGAQEPATMIAALRQAAAESGTEVPV